MSSVIIRTSDGSNHILHDFEGGYRQVVGMWERAAGLGVNGLVTVTTQSVSISFPHGHIVWIKEEL